MKATLLILLIIPICMHAQIIDSNRREIRLQGAINFRDIGGYPTKDGKHIKWGKIYRSAALNKLTDSDLAKLQALDIARIADFRGPFEVKAAPDRLPAGANRLSLPAGSENIGDSNYMKNMMSQMTNDSFLIGFYKDVKPLGARYKPMFDELLELNKDSALVFHCTAGKDRTGIAAALLLYVLGVDQNTILNDYLATNYYRAGENEKSISAMIKFYHMDSATAVKMMEARPEYLRATYFSIVGQYGTLDHFLLDEMGLDNEKIKKLRELYLE